MEMLLACGEIGGAMWSDRYPVDILALPMGYGTSLGRELVMNKSPAHPLNVRPPSRQDQ
jgi:hypothetical protein